MEPQEILEKISQYLVLLFSLSVHESAHAWSALQMGDDTAMREGRISLNPLVHIDPIGTVIFPLVLLFYSPGYLFGWAKPTPVQPRYFRHFRWGQVLTAGAGPASNLLLAVVFTLAYMGVLRAVGPDPGHPLVFMTWTGVWVNVILGIFNLLPVPPLDGSWIASWGLPRRLGDFYDQMIAPYGYVILMLLFVSGALDAVMGWFARPLVSALADLAQAGAGV